MYKLELLTPASSEPITTDEAKAHARIYGNDEDDYLAGLISAARIKFETETGFYLSQAEYKVTTKKELCREYSYSWCSSPNAGTHYVLPLRPVLSVESINDLVVDTDYTVSIDALTGQATIHFIADIDGDIVITFLVGFSGAETTPMLAKHALKSLVSHWYENREAYQAGSSIKTTPATYQSILQSYRLA